MDFEKLRFSFIIASLLNSPVASQTRQPLQLTLNIPAIHRHPTPPNSYLEKYHNRIHTIAPSSRASYRRAAHR